MQSKFNILKGKTRMLSDSLTSIEGEIKRVRSWVEIIREEIKKLEDEKKPT